METLKEEEVVKLEPPTFYTPELPECFEYKGMKGAGSDSVKDMERWRTIYSRINQVAIEGNKLVLQIRVCDKKLKKFALLFYNLDTFKLEDSIFTDDFFLGIKNGKYYFFANGDPTLDDGADTCTINICTLDKK